MRNYYSVVENNGLYWVNLKTLEGLPFEKPNGSYVILGARICNIYFDEYLFYVRDNFNAVLMGKNSRYITFYFKEKNNATKFCNLLNKRLNYILDNLEIGE